MEDLERVGLLAHRDELDGLAGHGTHGQGAAATGVAVELGHDHAVEVGALGELGHHVHDVLAGHGVDHHEHLVGLDGSLDVDGLLHHELVDLEAPSRVDDDHVAQVVNGVADRLARDGHGVLAVAAIDWHADLGAERGELVGGGGTVRVAGGELG